LANNEPEVRRSRRTSPHGIAQRVSEAFESAGDRLRVVVLGSEFGLQDRVSALEVRVGGG